MFPRPELPVRFIPSLPGTFLACAIVASTGCASRSAERLASSTSCELGDKAMVRDTIYFGRNKPAGGTVSDHEWQRFLSEVVTPRFPDGLTVTEARGQWKGKSGQVEREQSAVVTLLHKGEQAKQQAVSELIADYKHRFHQEAVLRERASTCARF